MLAPNHMIFAARRLRAAVTLLVIFALLAKLRLYYKVTRQGFIPTQNPATVATCPRMISDRDFSPAAIGCRILSAQNLSQSLLRNQSSTPNQAIIEYRRRYNRNPPKGFARWVQFALDHGSKVIDDFDQIDRDLKPYRTPLAQRAVDQIKDGTAQCPYTAIVSIRNGTKSASARYIYDDGLDMLIEPFIDELPDSTILLSTIDEARVLCSSGPPASSVQFIERPGKSIEDLVQASCKNLTLDLTSRSGNEKDVCQSPNPAKLHAFVAAPHTFSYTHFPVPILSFGRMSAFQDILIPCPCYVSHSIVQEETIPFLQKKPAVYWRGSSTGGLATHANWKFGHRERLVAFVQSLQAASNVLDISQRYFGLQTDSVYDNAKLIATFKDAFDIHTGAYTQCEEEACKDMARILGPEDREPENLSENYHYLYDLDGNSMSTRFYRLLSRQAVVLKQTWFQEWHNDRLIPWAHYIPKTMERGELPAVLNFLMNDPRGETMSVQVVQAGSRRAREVLRQIDMSIYIYRLLLEMAELFGNTAAS